MNDQEIIIVFVQLLKYQQSRLPQQALSDLSELDKKLPERLVENQIHPVADAIFYWCKKQKLIEMLTAERRIERGIKLPPSPNPANQELMKTNIYEIYPELKPIIQQIQNSQPKSQQP